MPLPSELPPLDVTAVRCLAIQHFSFTWCSRSEEFAIPLYLVNIFPGTLIPASAYGIASLVTVLLLSPFVGDYLDRRSERRLQTLRWIILIQKSTSTISYTGFFLLQHLAGGEDVRLSVLAVLILVGCGNALTNVAFTVAIERDWISRVGAGDSARLTRLNVTIRRIDLLSKLAAPLFVSLLTTTLSVRTSAIVLLGVTAASLPLELLWIGVVYRRFSRYLQPQMPHSSAHSVPRASLLAGLHGFRLHMKDFLRLPTLPTSIAIALLYANVLSFDGTFLAYLKQPHQSTLSESSSTDGVIKIHPGPVPSLALVSYTDPFISGMRGLCVACGLLGTILMPRLEKKIGLVRTGSWSLAQQFFSLLPTLLCLWIGVGQTWNTALLFAGMASSRIGLWSYDLAQIQLLQTTLYGHSHANFHFAAQQSLISLFDISHYVLTLVWSRPDQFSRPASISLGMIAAAWATYTFGYAQKQRGHLLHLKGMAAFFKDSH